MPSGHINMRKQYPRLQENVIAKRVTGARKKTHKETLRLKSNLFLYFFAYFISYKKKL